MGQTWRALIAGHDRGLTEDLATAMRKVGVHSFVSFDGLQANHLADTESYDLILVYVKLERMSGLQVAATAKNSKLNSKAVLVVLGSPADEEVLARLRKVGAVHYVSSLTSVEGVVKSVMPLLPKVAESGVYDVRIINAFVSAVSSIFESYFGVPPTIGKPGVKNEGAALGVVSTLMGFTGDGVRGSMAISFERNFLVELSGKIFSGLGVAVSNEAMVDLAGEMGNQVCGAVKLNIAKLGLRVVLDLPKVVTGYGHSIIHIVKNPVLIMPVAQGNDRCAVEFCMTRAAEEKLQEVESPGDIQGGDILLF